MLKFIYLLFSLLNLFNGAWMLLFPQSWYNDLPADVPHTGPFNAHFVRDLGVAFLVAGVSFAWSARNIDRSYPVHIGLTIFFTGHALIHLLDIATGHLPTTHWLIDIPGVFLPALLMTVLALPRVRRALS
ncbi:MAG TPA: hypothetical protein VNO50_06555 [Pyrinomonadaceae bacterium]|nr:hypothetical protein [Pyrinomonadaceae bacterium]